MSAAGLRQPPTVEAGEPLREEIGKLLPLARVGDAPIRAEHEARDASHIKILLDQLPEIGGLSSSPPGDRGIEKPARLLADELFLLGEGARIATQALGPRGPVERLSEMFQSLVAAHTPQET